MPDLALVTARPRGPGLRHSSRSALGRSYPKERAHEAQMRHSVGVIIGQLMPKSGSSASSRLARVAIAGLLAGTAAVQFWVSLTVAGWRLPLVVPAAVVALCGLLLPLAGSAVLSVLKKESERETDAGALLGAVTLAVVGFAWVSGWVIALLGVEGLVYVLCLAAARSQPSATRRLRVVLAPVPALVATAALLIVPGAPELGFKLQDESAANRLVTTLKPDLFGPCMSEPNLPVLTGYGKPISVCGVPGHFLVIRMSAHHDSLGLATSPSAFEDECVRHLDQNWWALADATPNCPVGYHFIPGA